jgi:hypothetical protein
MDIRLHRGQRQKKKNSEKEARGRCLTPPKSKYRNTTYYRCSQFEEKFGYDYEMGSSQVLDWMKQDFQDKMTKYLGNSAYVTKQSRMDKVRLKQALDFRPEVNPLVRTLSRVNRKV